MSTQSTPAKIHSVELPRSLEDCEMRTIFADEALGLGSGRQGRCHFAFHAGCEFCELLVAAGDGLTQLLIDFSALPEDEEVLLAAVAVQGFDDLLGGAAAAFVAQGGELFRVTLPGD